MSPSSQFIGSLFPPNVILELNRGSQFDLSLATGSFNKSAFGRREISPCVDAMLRYLACKNQE